MNNEQNNTTGQQQFRRLLLIDGHSLLHRAYHALPKLTAPNGEATNAIYGFLLILFKALKDFGPDCVIAAFDLPDKTFRDELFKDYKAQRPSTPSDLAAQINAIQPLLAFFGIAIFSKVGFEADDIIGSLCEFMSTKTDWETIIVSGDLDTLQLVKPQVKVYTLKKGVKETTIYGPNEVRARYGLEPAQLPDYKALRGDPSDNIPGVPGIGDKTAAQLIAKFKGLDQLYAQLESNPQLEIKPGLKQKLQSNKEQAYFSLLLSKIRCDLKLEPKLTGAGLQPDNARLIQEFERLGFRTMVNKLKELQFNQNDQRLQTIF